ncbi:hypothetical protein [Winogradskyella jejuensis]|uniref:Uncharacterized protein n=1 Tax=Winogradskyella jejuensis TaxID=1089305 RepID=A0A1M5VXR0_9FLAO|nr:hypothetical protein [Winogradskyella jejuensis]SHH79960.1 hypothetical protein SAMN05444148_2849 [Winogradskyella jejuensis]
MKKIIVITATLLMIISCQEKKSKSAVESAKVFESIKIERYSVQNGNPDSISFSSYIVKDFDGNGTEIKSIYYSSDNSIMMQFENHYENGNKTRIDWINGNDKKVKYVKMSYDDNKRLVKSESFDTLDVFISGFIHKWKEDGRIEEKGPIEQGKEFKPNSIYTYNDQQEFESLVEFDENDSLYGTFRWKYFDFNEEKEWIVRQMLFNDTIVRIEKRNIRYQK